MIQTPEKKIATLANSRTNNKKVSEYVTTSMINGLKDIKKSLQLTVDEFNRYLINNREIKKYYRNYSHEDKFRVFLESFTKTIKIEYATSKQRNLVYEWTGKHYSVQQRDLAYKVFYNIIYKAFRELCGAYGVKFEGGNSIYRVK